MNPLEEAYPRLAENLHRLPLAVLPTPVDAMPHLAGAVGAARVYVKRDDHSAAAYGGNKVRKLEYLLGDAQARGARTVITFGAAGSNHALATAIYARAAGMRCISLLIPQPNARYVQKNLLRSRAAGATLVYKGSIPGVAASALRRYAAEALRRNRPYLIMPGGTSPQGMLGFVAAAFELRAQVAAGLLPMPHRLYVASGTMGTAAGLALGLAAAQMPTHVMAVRVTDAMFTSLEKARRLFRRANRLLCKADPDFPVVPFPTDRFTFRHEFFGEEYARFTKEGMAAVRLARDTEDLVIEGTYTGKTLAALVADARAGDLSDVPTLFWNTYNSQPIMFDDNLGSYHELPRALHHYFEEPVQPLDDPDAGGAPRHFVSCP
ncbi:MAG: 1-aminocyclopropane-1-carboxylate deaminase/D-cysteine desulfhydrase [Candidatus Hydrogenedentota bacterium]